MLVHCQKDLSGVEKLMKVCLVLKVLREEGKKTWLGSLQMSLWGADCLEGLWKLMEEGTVIGFRL